MKPDLERLPGIIARIDAAMPFSTAQIEDWREQAKALAAEKK